jgi:mRNA interferase RelE/StbE
VNRFTVYVTPSALDEIKDLPGNIRQRIKRAIYELAENTAPSNSKFLDLTNLAPELDADKKLRRIRLDRWRIVYSISESEKIVDVLAIRKRPPYDYGDLGKLLDEIR